MEPRQAWPVGVEGRLSLLGGRQRGQPLATKPVHSLARCSVSATAAAAATATAIATAASTTAAAAPAAVCHAGALYGVAKHGETAAHSVARLSSFSPSSPNFAKARRLSAFPHRSTRTYASNRTCNRAQGPFTRLGRPASHIKAPALFSSLVPLLSSVSVSCLTEKLNNARFSHASSHSRP
ncbi:hypothetical protein GQ54DRAFT_31210 [Martensiomyces pterosporus]|nr:hypothetical protein GQ54DRAFT_31210 [Martensiomyces pterosporus]